MPTHLHVNMITAYRAKFDKLSLEQSLKMATIQRIKCFDLDNNMAGYSGVQLFWGKNLRITRASLHF